MKSQEIPKERASRSAPAASPENPFPIAGLGASAGGLESLEEFFTHLPPDTGIAFVVVTHQHPGHISFLPELLRRRTLMPVVEATDNLRVKPNCVYVAPPDGCLAILNGKLHLMVAGDQPGARLSIDYFFCSLAEDQRERAVGIILSGTASDGALGVKAIKRAGGLTMVQEPESAKYPGMPRSAIATGMVDCVMPAGQLPQRLAACAKGPHLLPREQDAQVENLLPEPMQKIIVLLRSRTGEDFSAYKPATMRRRIERRMSIHQISAPGQYLQILHENPQELDLLSKELLIGVTSLFRDPQVFAFLGETALPHLLRAKPEDAVVRVWVPGCSTGEEPYSLAILLREAVEHLKKRFTFQIFGTDLDGHAIDVARTGVYSEAAASEVSHARRLRFFTKVDGRYRVKKEIRETVVFARQDVLKDPPFTKLDLISCRNLLIYLNAGPQQRLLSLFHYALNPDGLLVLGQSESVGELREHFVAVEKKAKVYRRAGRKLALHATVEFPNGALESAPAQTRTGEGTTPAKAPQLSVVLEKLLLCRFAPACVIVNERGDISFIHGRTGSYLEPASGPPRHNLMEMAREGLQASLGAALRRAAAQPGEAAQEGVRVRTNGGYSLVDVAVSRITEPESLRGLFLVTFRPSRRPAAAAARPSKAASTHPAAGRVVELEQELLYTRESLASSVEELQTANEEFRSSNEELQSTNEEFQSTNEELETSKEEMQSLNEELQTVNAQLQSKIEALSQTSDDLQNVLNSTAIATVFLDRELRIRRFTDAARKVFNLIPGDVGRPIANLVANINYDQLVADASGVLNTLAASEREVLTKEGGWRLVRILPYRTIDNVIDGLVITLVDITRTKEAERAAERSRAYADSIVTTVREPLLVLDHDLRVVSANRAFYRCFNLNAAAVEGQLLYDIGGGQWRIPRLRHLLEDVLPKNNNFEDFEVAHDFPRVGRKAMRLNARCLEQDASQPRLILLAMEDVTLLESTQSNKQDAEK